MIVSWVRLSRKWHRWGAWGLSIIVLLWTVTGVIMIVPSGGHTVGEGSARDLELGADVVAPPVARAALEGDGPVRVRALSLEALGGRLYYRFTLRHGGTRLVDARTAMLFAVDDSVAARLARGAIRADAGIASLDRLSKSDGRYRGPFPVHRVVFDDHDGTTAYVATDATVSFADPRLRMKQIAGGLHTFAVAGLTTSKPTLRRWLLVVTSLGTIALVLTGLVLLLPLRRRESA